MLFTHLLLSLGLVAKHTHTDSRYTSPVPCSPHCQAVPMPNNKFTLKLFFSLFVVWKSCFWLFLSVSLITSRICYLFRVGDLCIQGLKMHVCVRQTINIHPTVQSVWEGQKLTNTQPHTHPCKHTLSPEQN